MVLLEFLYWKVIDIYRYFTNKNEKKYHLYGIYGFFGLPGAGKTMGMSWKLDQYRKKYKDNIYIITNFFWDGEDSHFDSWKMLLKEYDKPVVFAWDEVQNEFNSRDFKNFPVELLTLLTQNRKGHGKQILYTAQRWGRVDKVFRELTISCYNCKTHLGRLTLLKKYDSEDYDMLCNNTEVNKKMKIRSKRFSFVQTDKLRDSYNSYQMLESAKSKEYMTREEIKSVTFDL